MNTVAVNASKSYQVLIGPGLISSISQHVSSFKGVRRICIVSDSNVFPLYAASIIEKLQNSGFEIVSFVFPAGEESKNGTTYLSLLQFLAEKHLTRADMIVALGGGVVGDMAGFAAATFLRGIRLIQIPTTLLAAVDSSVGGKTAIDLPAGKNLAGAFFQPDLVVCDLDFLNSLPQEVFRDGCAEVIKYGVLYDENLFSHLETYGLNFDREYVITRCVELKRDAVDQDEYDTGARMKLNLGHTIGHSVESNSGYAVSHGSAVAIGMAVIGRSAVKAELFSSEDSLRLQTLLTAFGLPISTEYSSHELFIGALSDKKMSGKTVNLIVPERIGSCKILPTEVEQLEAFIQKGL